MSGTLMLEQIKNVNYDTNLQIIEEGKKENKPYLAKVRGIFQIADQENQNGRIYTRKLWESVLNSTETKNKLKNREMVGEADHPNISEVSIKNVSHVVTGLWMDGNRVMGEAEILDTPSGNIIYSLYKSKVPVGISSRGLGDITESDGKCIVDENSYQLITFDFVIGESVQGAKPQLIEQNIVNVLKDIIVESGKTNTELKQFCKNLCESFEKKEGGKIMETSDGVKNLSGEKSEETNIKDVFLETVDKLVKENLVLKQEIQEKENTCKKYKIKLDRRNSMKNLRERRSRVKSVLRKREGNRVRNTRFRRVNESRNVASRDIISALKKKYVVEKMRNNLLFRRAKRICENRGLEINDWRDILHLLEAHKGNKSNRMKEKDYDYDMMDKSMQGKDYDYDYDYDMMDKPKRTRRKKYDYDYDMKNRKKDKMARRRNRMKKYDMSNYKMENKDYKMKEYQNLKKKADEYKNAGKPIPAFLQKKLDYYEKNNKEYSESMQENKTNISPEIRNRIKETIRKKLKLRNEQKNRATVKVEVNESQESEEGNEFRTLDYILRSTE